MKIIIAGAGDVGFHLAKMLAFEAHDTTIIDTDDEKLKYVSEHLDVQALKGNATSFRTLGQAQVSKADMLIAVTESEPTNLSTCIIGKKLGAKKTIARVSNTEYLHKKDTLDLQDIGIDEVISPESLAAKEIRRLLKQTALTDVFDFEKGVLSLVGITIEEESELKDKTLRETAYLNPERNFTTVAILRDGKTIIPYGENRFMLNDHAYFICRPDGVQRVLDLTKKECSPIKNVMILGASKIGIQTALLLGKKHHIKLIEENREKSLELTDMLQDAMIINSDGRNVALLKEESISQMDAFIAVTGNSETNIISSLVAKNHGVFKTIALVENMDYIHLSQNIGVDTMINKKLIAASFIFRYIREGQVINMTTIHGVDAEILEFEVSQGCMILSEELRHLQFPKFAIVGGVIRNGQGHIARGDFRFEVKDRVVVLAQREAIKKVEKLFK